MEFGRYKSCIVADKLNSGIMAIENGSMKNKNIKIPK